MYEFFLHDRSLRQNFSFFCTVAGVVGTLHFRVNASRLSLFKAQPCWSLVSYKDCTIFSSSVFFSASLPALSPSASSNRFISASFSRSSFSSASLRAVCLSRSAFSRRMVALPSSIFRFDFRSSSFRVASFRATSCSSRWSSSLRFCASSTCRFRRPPTSPSFVDRVSSNSSRIESRSSSRSESLVCSSSTCRRRARISMSRIAPSAAASASSATALMRRCRLNVLLVTVPPPSAPPAPPLFALSLDPVLSPTDDELLVAAEDECPRPLRAEDAAVSFVVPSLLVLGPPSFAAFSNRVSSCRVAQSHVCWISQASSSGAHARFLNSPLFSNWWSGKCAFASSVGNMEKQAKTEFSVQAWFIPSTGSQPFPRGRGLPSRPYRCLLAAAASPEDPSIDVPGLAPRETMEAMELSSTLMPVFICSRRGPRSDDNASCLKTLSQRM
mmetsp:Transcript_27452/g.69228  ORF Transcript_27452/g.69228 Transcript_27452/m.69228 type:complete len:442 (-) Transcript_27452:382-1707(-)